MVVKSLSHKNAVRTPMWDRSEGFASLLKKPETVTTGNSEWTHKWEAGDSKNFTTQCYKCGEEFVFNRDNMPWNAACVHCGGAFNTSYFQTPIFKVALDDVKFFEKKRTMRATWFHATTSKDWLNDVLKGGVMVHVGSMGAARDRANDIMRDWDDGARVFIYEVAMDKDTTIGDAVYPDMNDFFRHEVAQPITAEHTFQTSEGTVSASKFLREMYDENVDVVRYVNQYESVGSISLLVNPRVLKVVKVTGA